MIQQDYVLQMARYNAWQNNQLRDIVKTVDEAQLTADQSAFFGSVLGTLNHILWGDTVWMSRWCSDVANPASSIAQSPAFTPNSEVWDAERFGLDGRIRMWAQTLSNMDLCGDVSWFSGALNQDVTRPMSVCVMHMFTHQTHHRGQISQMLFALGITPPVSDLFIMPEDA